MEIFDSPFAPALVASIVAGLGFGALTRLVRMPLPANLVAPLVFLVAYYATYQKIPGFPPVGSVNKIFYIVLALTLAGVALDLLAGGRIAAHRIAIAAAPLLIAVWIGQPRLANPDIGLAVALPGLVVGGALLLWRLASVAGADGSGGGAMAGWMLLAVLPAVFAPIALFGGSSTSVGLCLGLTAGIGAAAVVGLFAPRSLGLTAILGAGGGLLAVIDTVTLITRRADPLALVALLAVLFAGQVGARFLLPAGRLGARLRAVAVGLMAASVIVPVVAILLLRNDNPLGN